ncbi:E3 ubiquitin-protein ligase MARCHF5-like [Drosophila subobscura]|uniref:E3 ubiquitin-protein ligase MARCHF5-like n=1 Tax=Drosophila subobscura TaxID=7241 RepID=UPI00155B1546|nr:E3 ubiquitin-protein ligase MARCHF5-like [Drosophila subobscura]
MSELDEERMCWICLEGDVESSQHTHWVHPCRCRGSNKWVHHRCLNRWIDELQSQYPKKPIACPQCRTKYLIWMPPLCRFDAFLVWVDDILNLVCPSVDMAALSAVLFFSTVTFGALTMIQIVGYNETLTLLHEQTTLASIALPTIPAGLLLTRHIRVDRPFLRFLHIFRIRHQDLQPEDLDEEGEPLPGAPLGDDYFDELPEEHGPEDINLQLGAQVIISEEARGAAASFVVALSLPSFAVLLGRTLYGNIGNRYMGIFLGGITFLGIKGLASAYMRHAYLQRMRGRFVLQQVQL